MISRLLALVVLLLAGSAYPAGFGRGGGLTCPKGYIGGGLMPCTPRPYFEFAPADGAGMGAACACAAVTGASGEAITFSRASTAYCTKPDYSLAQCAANQPRVMSGGGTTSPLGLLVESAATNSVLYSRDLSQASWTKSSMLCALTAVGVDGASGSASTCTASGSNGTVLQTVTASAATRSTSLFIRRSSGTGSVSVTRDGTTYFEITADLSSNYKRVVPFESVGCAYGGCIVATGPWPFDGGVGGLVSDQANPVVGVKLATSGDAIDIDLVQDEIGSWASSPISTTAAPASRGVERATATVRSFVPLAMSSSIMIGGASGAYCGGVGASDSTLWLEMHGGEAIDVGINGDCYLGSLDLGIPTWFGRLGPTQKRCSVAPGVSLVAEGNGAPTTYSGAGIVSPAATTTITIGSDINPANGVVSQVCADPVSTACTASRSHPTSIVWVGDSITYGTQAGRYKPPAVLASLLKHRTVSNSGNAGDSTMGGGRCLSRAAGAISAHVGTLIYACGTNDLGAGRTGAELWAATQPTLDAARFAGLKVVPVHILPRGGYETNRLLYNSYLTAWCASTGSTCVDTSSMGTGSPAVLLPQYDSGDGLHPSSFGSVYLATLVQAANP